MKNIKYISLIFLIVPFLNAQQLGLPFEGTKSSFCSSIGKEIIKVLNDNEFKAATFAVYNKNRLVCNNGYGFQNKELTQNIDPNVKMRIASVGKPVAAVLIKHLFRTGEITPDTRVFGYLNVQPYSFAKSMVDPRVHDITIQNLLDHEVGWDKSHDGYSKYSLNQVKKLSGEKNPSVLTISKYMMGQKLQTTPGTSSVYSNFGYALLKEIIQKATDKDYVAYLSNYLTEYNIDILRSLPKTQRSNSEIWYSPESSIVQFAFAISAKDLAKLFTKYWINGDKKIINNRNYTFYGSWPSTSAILRQRKDGITYSLLINTRGKVKNSEIKKLIDNKIDKLK